MVAAWARALVLTATACVGVAAVGSAARAGDLVSPVAPVRSLIADVHYEEAGALVETLIDQGGLSRADLLSAYRLGGEIFAALGDARRARRYFMRWLALQPTGELPRGRSPKIVRPYQAARRRVRARGPLQLRHEASRGGDQVTVGLLVDADPFRMVAGMRVMYGAGAHAELTEIAEAPTGLTATFDVADGDAVRMMVIAIDARGNELAIIGDDEPIALAPALTLSDSREAITAGPVWYANWKTWAAVAGVSVGAGAYFGHRARSDLAELEALNAASASHTYAEARAIEQRGKRNATLSNASFGAAGLAAAAAIVCGVRASRRNDAPTVQPHAGDGATVGVSVRLPF